MMYELISFRETILDALTAGTAYKRPRKELQGEILKESKRILSSIQHNITQIAPDRLRVYLTQHQRGLIQLMEELETIVNGDNHNAGQKNKTEEISSISNLLNQMVLDLQHYFPYYFDYHSPVSVITQKQLLLVIAENSSQILKNLEGLHTDNETIEIFTHIFEQLNSGIGRFTFEQAGYLHDFFESLKIELKKFAAPLQMPGIILLLTSLNFNHPSFYHSCCNHFNQELQKCESISEQNRLIHFFKKLIGQVFKTISISYNRNLPNIDESLLRYIESEISYLKSIDTIAEDLSSGGILDSNFNPHFLFNTLTYIYNSTHKSEPRAAEAVRYLSKLMRYALECEHGPEIMPLEAEIRQVENLLQLSRIKQPDLFIDFSYDQKIESTEVIPLLLLSLTENMVKHGNLSQPEDPGKIRVKLQAAQFSIQTSNLINTGLNDTGFHTGLENIRQRLLHTYADRAAISSGLKGNYFEVLITINLPEAR
ncbi:hypothetical protein EZ456_13295 [Pedobacter psychrodurus]|uniref:Signal transduction histidine kinase internal region domain-containing protein n=1 Tax=Pedobacter psychrodurus TaxID=2530456 RepID=A0A4R0PVE0_9SPHI|nr:histidine kinase [Pedobacter psychrodurus]TCD26559.1 hypothetical protein EZ456_13295 [Pedobacter psychrodurus]